MRISRFYVPLPLNVGMLTELPEDTAHHVRNVLRLKPGSPLVLFSGDGQEFSGEISSVAKKSVQVALQEVGRPRRESPLRSHLGLALARGERMDYAVQKCTELGVTSITPLFTERSEVRLQGDRIEKRLRHWQQVAVSACEQSARLQIPTIHPPQPLQDWVGTCPSGHRFLLDHRQSRALPTAGAIDELSLLTGPEGGFSENEIAAAQEAGFQAIALGPRVFRAETAPVVALSLLQWHWGDLQGCAEES